jgi:hypothetical protein
MRRITRRAATLSAVAGLLTSATLLSPHTATAADVRLAGFDVVAAPGSVPRFYPTVESGAITGKIVVAVGTQPMTDSSGAGAGLPDGYQTRANDCHQPAGYVGVFVCTGSIYRQPEAVIPANAADMTLFWGFAPLPANADLDSAVEAARSAGSRPADGRNGTGKVTVKSRAHALLNTVGFDLHAVPDGGTVRQQLRVHANDAGRLMLRLSLAEGQLIADAPPISIGNVTSGPGAACEVRHTTVPDTLPHLLCDVETGDHIIGYELTSMRGQYAQRIQAHTRYDIYDLGVWDESDVKQHSVPFQVQGNLVRPWHGLHGRATTGKLWTYTGSTKGGAPLGGRREAGRGWQAYTAVTSLSPYTQPLHYQAGVKPSVATRGRGDLVARDAVGVLWYYDRQFVADAPFSTRVRAGSGWNIYDRITGAGDLTGDGYVDLLARDKTGALWLYQGTGSLAANGRFKTRIRIGTGWQIYQQFAGGDDLTGDGRADLLARDKTGVLWLYRGTGKVTTPYAGRIRIGTGWQGYDQLVVTGDLTDDGRADAVARDRTGVLWLYKGTGKPTAPFAARARVGGGWNAYNVLF